MRSSTYAVAFSVCSPFIDLPLSFPVPKSSANRWRILGLLLRRCGNMPSALLVLVDRCNKRLFLDRSFERFNRFGRGLELDPFGISSLDISNRLSNGLGSFRGGFGCSLLLLLDRVRRPVVGSFGRSSGFLLGNGFGAFWFGVRRLLYRNFTIAWEDCRKVVPATTFTLASTDGCSRSYENGSKEEDETCKLRNVAEEGREHLGGDFSCGVDVVGSWLFQDENNKPLKKNPLILILCGRAACCRFVHIILCRLASGRPSPLSHAIIDLTIIFSVISIQSGPCSA